MSNPISSPDMSDRSDPVDEPDAAEILRRQRVREAGQRALAEAQAREQEKLRRLAQTNMNPGEGDQTAPEKQREINGPSGPEPTRYGDWDRKGIAVDF